MAVPVARPLDPARPRVQVVSALPLEPRPRARSWEPSGTNGLAGLRPTFGRVSRYGVMALGWTYDRLGPMCRYAEDCAMVMSVIAKPDGRDMSISELPFNWDPSKYDLKKLKIGVVAMNGPDINPNAQKLMDTLKKLGATITPLTIPPDNLPPFDDEGYNVEQGAFFDELLVRGGGVERMTSPTRGAGFKSARLMTNVVDFLQGQRIRMMMMRKAHLQGLPTWLRRLLLGGSAGSTRRSRWTRRRFPAGAPPAAAAAGHTSCGRTWRRWRRRRRCTQPAG